MASRIYPMGLLFSAVLILTIPGILFNNFTSSGLNPAFALTCPQAYAGDFTCQNSNATGCQAFPAECSLSGTSVSILNRNSPFTAFFTGGITGLFQFINGQGPATSGAAPQGPFDLGAAATQGTYYVVNCGKTGGGAHQSVRLLIIDGCTQINPVGNQNVSKASALVLTNWNTGANQANAVVTTPFFGLTFGPNGTGYNFNCALVGQGTSVTGYGSSNHTADLNGYTYYGCDLYKGANPNTAGDPWMSVMLSVPNVTSQGLGAGYQHFTAFMVPTPWESYFCGLAGYSPSLYIPYSSPQCTNFFNALNRWTVDAAGNTFDGGVLAPIITFVLGTVLLIIGLGINFRVNGSFFGSGAGAGAGVNRQGTKLAQIVGISLIVWSPLYSEFSTWFTSGLLPNGLDGSAGVIGIGISAMFFGGTLWQMTQD